MHPASLLDACAVLLGQVLKFEHPADMVVSRFLRQHREFGPRERALLGDCVFAVLRRKLLFEHLACAGSGPKERRLAILGFPGPRDFLERALNDSEQRWLQACDALPPSELLEQHRHNLPKWLAQALQAQLGVVEFWAFVDAVQHPAPLDLRVNTLRAKRAEVQAEMANAGIEAAATPLSPWGLRLADKPALHRVEPYRRGDVEIQDEGSQLLALLVDARRGEMVVDFCAGAGGKTLALGASMRNTGRLYAFDTSAHRLDALGPRLARSGLSNVHPAAIAHERDDRVKRLAGKIDRVLVDAPCSGLGTLRRNPDLKWRLAAAEVPGLAARQGAILQGAARLVKPGGRLVYATCSLLREENEDVVEAFDAACLGFASRAAAGVLQSLKVEGTAGLCSGGAEGGRYLRLWPQRHGTDGFFAAIWDRR